MKSLERSFLERQAVPLEFAGTLRLLGEYLGKQELYTRQTPQVLNTLKQVAIIQSAKSSNWIEGVIVEEKRRKGSWKFWESDEGQNGGNAIISNKRDNKHDNNQESGSNGKI